MIINGCVSKINIMKLSIFLILNIFLICSPVSANNLNTANYMIRININCEDFKLPCDKVTCIVINKNSGDSLELTGRTIFTPCEDGLKMCSFIGYELKNEIGENSYLIDKNDENTYFIDENGTFIVTDESDEVLSKETGVWTY